LGQNEPLECETEETGSDSNDDNFKVLLGGIISAGMFVLVAIAFVAFFIANRKKKLKRGLSAEMGHYSVNFDSKLTNIVILEKLGSGSSGEVYKVSCFSFRLEYCLPQAESLWTNRADGETLWMWR
jgi:hypothetical protein